MAFSMFAGWARCTIHRTSLGSVAATRAYISRAHPKPRPAFPIRQALADLVEEADKRNRRRRDKWSRNQQRAAKSSPTTASATATGAATPSTPDSPAGAVDATTATTASSPPQMDETVELAINLNLDPRKPGQSLRGSIILPNGTGKRFNCLVFTDDDDLAAAALEKGAAHAGGVELIKSILDGEIALDKVDRALGTPSIMPDLSKQAARLLGPRGLMPNAKAGTLISPRDNSGNVKDALLAALDSQVAGREVPYRTEREGVVHVPVGKVSFGVDRLLENMGAVFHEIHAAKPEFYGRGRKASRSGKATSAAVKYVLKAFLSATQGSSYLLEDRTIDPSSPFFLSSAEERGAA